tara:strand:- start:467 stop:628 length:162 start_codon:yes stop_codon:yes gene_type:complete
MIRLFRFLFFGDAHVHKWACVEKQNRSRGEKLVAIDYILKCEICGKMKKFTND